LRADVGGLGGLNRRQPWSDIPIVATHDEECGLFGDPQLPPRDAGRGLAVVKVGG
jgi:hypothetical protein